MSLQQVEPVQPLVDGVLALFGVAVAPIGIAVGLSKLKARNRALEKFAAAAVTRIAGRGREFTGLAETDREAVETRVTELLALGSRERLLAAAVLGAGPFAATLTGDRAVAVAGLDAGAVSYLDELIRTVHGLVDEFARTPELYPAASEAALRSIAAALAQTSDQVQRMHDELLDELRAELGRRPKQIVAGGRPQLAGHFVDRDEMTRLETALSTAGLATVCALQGMRGVGKSQLASAFAQRCEADSWVFVGWVNASTRAQAIEELAGTARAAGLAPDDVPLEEAAGRLVTWLSDGSLPERLLVFDNVEDADDLAGLVPRGNGMRVIVTTTSTLTTLGFPVEVGVFSLAQAAAYLSEATGLDDSAGAEQVATDLDRLPVALTQAASTIRALGIGFGEYRQLLADYPLEEATLREAGASYPLNVGRALRLAYQTHLDLLADTDPAHAQVADRVLGALSLLAESGTPKAWLRVLAEDPFTALRVVGGLQQRSVLIVDTQGRMVSLHRLMARVIREDAAGTVATGDQHQQAAVAVLAGLEFDPDSDYWTQRSLVSDLSAALAALLDQPQSRPLIVNPTILAAAAETIYRADRLGDPYAGVALSAYVDLHERVLGADHPNTLSSRNNLAGAYESAGDLGRAIPLYQQTLTDRERVLGADHPNTLSSRNNLAGAYESAGDLGRAIPLYQQTLTDRERVLGADHPNTLTSRNNLAYAYESAGDLGRAIPLYQQTLTDRERVLGADHPDTLTSRNNLAYAYRSAGDLGRAIPLYQQTLTDRERVLGADHPDTLTSRNNLAYAYRSAGDLGRAIPLYQQTLTDMERVLGADHPNTLTSRNNLAGAYESAGDLGRAIPLYQQTLTDRERVLGADHPNTLTSRNNLAYAYRSAGDLGRAIPLYQQTLTDRERVLGADHPDTLTSRNNLAGAYQAAGDLGRAIPLYQQTLTDMERVLGADHPDTLTSRNNLAGAYESAGDLSRAIPLLEQSLADMERVLGADHPDTLTSRNNLAGAYESAGDLGRAIPLYQQTLTDRERVLGADHPNTLTSRNNLAGAYESAGDLGRAIPLLEQSLADMERVLGADHPNTLTSRNNLAYAYRSAGDLSRAIPLYQQTLTDMERVLGADHPDTLTSRNNLAGAYQATGDLSRAIPLYQQTLTDRERVLGADHPDTLTSRNNLAGALWGDGRRRDAAEMLVGAAASALRLFGADHVVTRQLLANAAVAVEEFPDLRLPGEQ